MPEQPMTGRTLAALRVAHGWTQAELAERTGMSERQVSLYERGETEPSPRDLFRLGEALHAPRLRIHAWIEAVTELVHGGGDPPSRHSSPPSPPWPFPAARFPWEREGDAPGPTGDDLDDEEVDRLAREAADLADRFVRLYFRRPKDKDER